MHDDDEGYGDGFGQGYGCAQGWGAGNGAGRYGSPCIPLFCADDGHGTGYGYGYGGCSKNGDITCRADENVAGCGSGYGGASYGYAQASGTGYGDGFVDREFRTGPYGRSNGDGAGTGSYSLEGDEP